MPPHTEPANPAALFVAPSADLHAVPNSDGVNEQGADGPTVDDSGTKRTLDGTHAWNLDWDADVGVIGGSVYEMQSSDDADAIVQADVASSSELMRVAPGAHLATFDVPGVQGAVGVEDERPRPDGTTTTYTSVLFPVGIYFVEYTVIADHGHGPEVATRMAQAEAAHLRELG